MGRRKLSKQPTAILLVPTVVWPIEMTGSLGGVDVGDGGGSDRHVNQTSVLACLPVSCLAVCMAWVACVTMVTELLMCACVCICDREILLEGRSV